MALADITDKDFEKEVLKNESPVVVDFWAAWCGPCKMAEPVLSELSDEYEGKIKFVKVNVDKNRESPMKYNVRSIPTTVLFKNGKEIKRQVGFSGKVAFEELLQNEN